MQNFNSIPRLNGGERKSEGEREREQLRERKEKEREKRERESLVLLVQHVRFTVHGAELHQ